MSTVCGSLLRGKRMRVTRLDNCGRPIYGSCNQVVTSGFVTVTMGSETEDGDDITVTTAGGDTCVSEAGKTSLKWYTVQVEFCLVDPDLVTMINPGWRKIVDSDGNAVGWDETNAVGDDAQGGYALEIWSDVYAPAGDACKGSSTAQGQWGHIVLPWVRGGTPDDLEVTNDAVSFTYNGTTKLGAGWGSGPYPVQLVGGVPSGLTPPVEADTHRRVYITTIAPPEAECGCQDVERPTPPLAEVTVQGITGEKPRLSVRLTVDNHGFGPTIVDWGDGTATTEVADLATATHKYPDPGDTPAEYTIWVADKQTPGVRVSKKITIPLPADAPQMDLSQGADNMTVVALIDNHGNGDVTVAWGDGTTETYPEPSPITATHTYTYAGIYTIRTARADLPQYVTKQAVIVPIGDNPTVTAVKDDSDSTNMTAKFTVDNHGNGATTLDFGDGKTGDGPAQDGGTVSHQYKDAKAYSVITRSKANPLASAKTEVTVPFS